MPRFNEIVIYEGQMAKIRALRAVDYSTPTNLDDFRKTIMRGNRMPFATWRAYISNLNKEISTHIVVKRVYDQLS